MEKVKTSKIEKLKNILLVVLVLTTILLLYFLWGSQSLEAFMFNDNQEHYEILSPEEVIKPNKIILGRGNGDYTAAYLKKEELWNSQILNTFRNFSKDPNILVEEITEGQYKEAMKYSSIIAKFEYDIPFNEFCETYNIKQVQGYDSITNLTEVGFSKVSQESVFIFDNNKKKYYRAVGNKELQIFNDIDNIFSQQKFITYYTLKTFLGEESNNETLIPVEFPRTILPIDYNKETEIAQKDIIGDMAQTYFGETFDFVRKVEESNGTTIYMYGYGQKVLIINPNEGSIEYKAEIKNNNPEQKSMIESLDAALTFVGKHGGFHTIAGEQIKPYLQSVSSINDKNDSYKFVFSFMIGKNKLLYEENMPIIIEVSNGQISYFRREFINFDQTQIEKRSNQEGISAINMMAANYEYMKDSLIKAEIIDKKEAQTISFEDIANKTDDLYVGYLKSKDNIEQKETNSTQERLTPVWVVEIDDFLLYFDLYNGEPCGYSKVY